MIKKNVDVVVRHHRYWDIVNLGARLVLGILCAPLFLIGFPIAAWRKGHPLT